jgi:blue copper oxidase
MPHDRTSKPVTRRDFMRLASGSAAAAVGGLSLLEACDRDASKLLPPTEPLYAKKGAVARYPLRIPSAVSPNGLTLTEGAASADLGGGNLAGVWAYNGQFPAPTIVARTGDSASITLNNALSEETITHWHGMLVPTVMDGHPRYAIPPGGTYSYQFPIAQRAALNFYHPHPHMLTGKQVCLGLAGAFIVRDSAEDALGLPSGAYEVPLIVRDASLDTAGNLAYKPRSGGFVGDIALVNGTRDPYLNVDTALYRFRLLNGSNARIYRFALSTGAPFTLIGNDGGLLEAPVQLTEITVAPAERLDLLIDFRGLAVNDRVMLRCLDAGWDLLQFVVARQVTVAATIPTALCSIPALTNPTTTRTFSFDGMSKINGKLYDMNRVDFRVPFGQTERWIFTTNGNAPHPVHVHGASFQVQTRTGGRNTTFPWERGWKDTVLVHDLETVEVLIRFDAYRGLYLLHCHKLEHEDMGMMSNFEVY